MKINTIMKKLVKESLNERFQPGDKVEVIDDGSTEDFRGIDAIRRFGRYGIVKGYGDYGHVIVDMMSDNTFKHSTQMPFHLWGEERLKRY